MRFSLAGLPYVPSVSFRCHLPSIWYRLYRGALATASTKLDEPLPRPLTRPMRRPNVMTAFLRSPAVGDSRQAGPTEDGLDIYQLLPVHAARREPHICGI